MTTRVLKSPADIAGLASFLGARNSYPITVTIVQGDNRSGQQNRLAQRWFTDIARQLGDQTHEDIRALCKLEIGVPILRTENEAFRQSYDASMKHLPYATKLEAMKRLDIPVTRMMSVKQMTAFMDAMSIRWGGVGIRLTDPEALRYEEEFA